MTESKSPFRESGQPLVIDANPPWKGLMQIVSHGVPMAAACQNVSDLVLNPFDADTLLGKRTTDILPMFDLHDGEIGHTVVFGPTGKGMSVLPEMLQGEYQKHSGKLAVFDKGTSLSGLMNQDMEEA